MRLNDALQAPFPWFGGKSAVAADIWARFGDVPNFVEPFFGSGAVLLARPHKPRTETVNDRDGNLVNFWRAIQREPEEVAAWCDWPVSEPDLHARHLWLLETGAERSERLCADPDWHDSKAAGWWVWGLCSWIGSGWCSGEGPWISDGERLIKRDAGQGIKRKRPHLGNAGRGINRQRPHLGNAGRGINRQLPHLGNAGRGINRQLPHLADGGQGIAAWFLALSERLRRVRITCGDWSRVCGPSVTVKHGLTAVFLDPPYTAEAGRKAGLYAHDDLDVGRAVHAWCRENGDNPLLRVALCGYEGEYELPGWECLAWKAHGGYGGQGEGRGRENSGRERIWFSPHCLKVVRSQISLFSEAAP